MFYLKPFSYASFLTYKIEKGDTLESVAAKLDIEVYELKSFHNTYCPLDDFIRDVFPSHLEFLILESEEEKTAKEAYREKIHFSNKDFKLPFLPAYLNNKYLAKYTIQNGNEKHTIKEEINVKWLATDSNNYYFLEIDRKALYVDDNYSKNTADELAEKTAVIFYPLQIVVDSDGDYVDIYNFNEIRDRWYTIRENILKEFNGEAVKERLKIFEDRLKHDEIISKSFNNDWFLRAFFNGLNIEYKETLTFQNKIKFPVSQKVGEVQFLVQQTILPAVDQYNLVNITQKGFLSDIRSKDDFENGLPFSYYVSETDESEKVQGTFEAYYFLDPNTNTTESLFMECEIKLDIPQKVTIEISNLDEIGKLILDTGINLYLSDETKSQKADKEIKWMIIAIIIIVALAVFGIVKFYF